MTWLLGNLAVAETLALTISHAVGIAVSFFIITTLHIVLGEQAPKVFAIRAPEQTALFIAQPLAIFNRVFSLVIRFLDWATDAVLKLFGIHESGGHTKVHSADELRLLVEESGEAGVLDEDEQAMLINVFALPIGRHTGHAATHRGCYNRSRCQRARVSRSLRRHWAHPFSGAGAGRRR